MTKITIKDVALRAGVSVKTVSRVINNEVNVRAEMQEKVKKAVNELGFRRNPLARALRNQQTSILSLLYSNPNPGYILEVQNGIQAQCDLDNYNLQILPCDHNDEHFFEKIESLLQRSSTDGVLLIEPLCDMPEVIDLLDKYKLPYALISPATSKPKAPFARSNDEQASYQMTEYLISQGHKDIAFIMGDPSHGDSHQRLKGYQNALAEYNISVDDTFFEQGYFTFESGEISARRLLSLKNRPSAIFASNDYMAAAVLKVAAQKQIKVPQELSIVGYDDTPVSKQIWPALTTVRQPIRDISSHATKKLIAQLNKCSFDEVKTLFECQLVVRESTSVWASD
ncbi:LacI family DNA-binding transcriptional regulator [Colwellia psychrerythraea]|uniref:Transcription regulator, LacI family n=1 Tax=Colwellia psychrerythraea (strain 34H / ATCC BAA-681) TaxID=167879 RepID=Q482C4_COLP3|nr:LacI family DNA-binding transcriptional regulator [Colwellia psychrerythraea]AAZ25692.1 transcription regulator, LacI family [Colwellia psychrerythraea 34H]